MKKYAWFSLFLLFPFLSFSQDIQVLDILSGRFMGVNKMQIDAENDRYYSLTFVKDSFELNGQIIYIDTSLVPREDNPYLIGVNKNKNLKFIKQPGGELILLRDSSFLVFADFSRDTFFTTDTFFIQENPNFGEEIVAIDYDLKGNRIGAKHWTSPHKTGLYLTAVVKDKDAIYLAGAFSQDTLRFDNIELSCFYCSSDGLDGFVAKFDHSLTCQWIERFAGFDNDGPGALAVGKNHTILTLGAYRSSTFYACEDSLSNPFGGFANDLFIAELRPSGVCNFLKRIGGYGNEANDESTYLSDGSILMSGTTNSRSIDFQDTVFQNVATGGFNGIIGKYTADGEFIKALQLQGTNYQEIRGMVVDDNDDIWICGHYASDTITFGTTDLFLHTPGQLDAFIAKYDKDLRPLYAVSIAGNGLNTAYEFQRGQENKLYCLLAHSSDTLFVNNEIFKIKTQRAETLSIQIKDIPTTITSIPPYAIDINLYPNPLGSNDVLHFELSGERVKALQNIKLYSIHGQVLSAYSLTSIENKQIQLPRLSAGLYYVVFDFGEKRVARKIVIQ